MAKKVLIVGPKFFNYNQSIQSCFIKLGFEAMVRGYETLTSNVTKKVINKLFYISNCTKFTEYEIKKFNYGLIQDYLKFKPDIVLVIKGEILFASTLQAMSDCLRICWMQDSIFRFQQCMNNVQNYDKLFLFEKTDVDKLESIGIKSEFLPMAFDDTIYFPVNHNKDIDILFIGTLKGDRIKLLKTLIKCLPNLNIQIYGKYLPVLDFYKTYKYFTQKEYMHFKNINVCPVDSNILYSRTKIALNIHISQSSFGCNPRVYEILGSRTFQLVDYNPFIAKEFGGMLSTYKSPDEMIQNIRYYIKNDKEREQIASLGYNKVSQSDRFIDRVSTLLYLSL